MSVFAPSCVKAASQYLQPVMGADGALLCVHALNLEVVREVQRDSEARVDRNDVLTGHSMRWWFGVSRAGQMSLWLIKYTTIAGYWSYYKKEKIIEVSPSLFTIHRLSFYVPLFPWQVCFHPSISITTLQRPRVLEPLLEPLLTLCFQNVLACPGISSGGGCRRKRTVEQTRSRAWDKNYNSWGSSSMVQVKTRRPGSQNYMASWGEKLHTLQRGRRGGPRKELRSVAANPSAKTSWAPGPNGVSYLVYKRCPKLTRICRKSWGQSGGGER